MARYTNRVDGTVRRPASVAAKPKVGMDPFVRFLLFLFGLFLISTALPGLATFWLFHRMVLS